MSTQYNTKPLTESMGEKLNTNRESKFLGFKLQVTGITGHITDRINKGKAVISKLRRFGQLTLRFKATLITAQLMQVLEYPPIPLCSLSKTQTFNMQKNNKHSTRVKSMYS